MFHHLITNSKIRKPTIFPQFIFIILILFSNQLRASAKEEREHLILNARRDFAEEKMSLGKEAMVNKKYFLAFRAYKEAVDALSKPKLESTALYQEARYFLNQAAVPLILKYISLLQYDDSEKIISIITDKDYFFEYPPALFLTRKLHTIDKKKGENGVSEASQELTTLLSAIDFYQSGDWKKASEKYNIVLHLNPNNIAAQVGLELLNQEKSNSINSIAHQEQNKMIEAIDKSWALPPPNASTQQFSTHEQVSIPTTGTNVTLNKIHNIIVPKIEFIETPLQSALTQLQQKAFLLDITENDPNKRGVNIVLALDIKKLIPEPKITLTLIDTPLAEILKYVAQQAHLKIKIEPYAIAIIPEGELSEALVTKKYKVSSSFIAKLPDFCHLDEDSKSTSKRIENSSIKDILTSQGITFPTGATAHYLPSSNILIVKNSQTNLNLIDSLVEDSFSTPQQQVEIEARFLEVKQSNLKERGLDWLLGAFQLGNTIQTGEGNAANQSSNQTLGYPVQNPTGTGSRIGTTAINANALETLLFGSSAGSATGVLALAGVLTNPQFQVILRAINQHKGVNLLSAPKITVSNGKRASIRIAREFPYPADYSPPQIPQNQGTSVNPAVPTTPSSFKKRNVGVQLEVEPIINYNNQSIELNLSPEIVEFQGFINYGSPIFSQAPVFLAAGQTNVVTSTAQVLLTPNAINQPVFSVRQVETQVVLHDGQTVVLGGLMREDIKKIEHKVPILGNTPLVGSLFRSSSEQKIKRNLLIFVTAHLLSSSESNVKINKINVTQEMKNRNENHLLNSQ